MLGTDPTPPDDEAHHVAKLPMLVLMPHAGCNCRCLMCDIWKVNRDGHELRAPDLAPVLADLRALDVRLVTLSGGEALLSPSLWRVCAALRELDVFVSLMSTGLLLRRHAAEVVRWCDAVTVSLDGSRDVHDAIRRVPRAYDRLVEGVATLKALRPGLPVIGRCVIQRRNYRDLPNVIRSAKAMGLDTVSFLPADVSSPAFGRAAPWDRERVAEVVPGPEEAAELAQLVESVILEFTDEFASGFVHERPSVLRRLPQYYRALNGEDEFPEVRCNAPWISAVVEADGAVRPCYFQPALGSLREERLPAILDSDRAVAFRRGLDVERDPVCRRCVCPLYLPELQCAPAPDAARTRRALSAPPRASARERVEGVEDGSG
jgi:MoaA/NifB/PqqE/SkfB family radical SAM enzyme